MRNQRFPNGRGFEVFTSLNNQLLNHVQLFVIPWTVVYHAPPSMEFSRQEYRSGLPFPSPGDLPNPGINPRSPALPADTLLSEPWGKLPSEYGRCSRPGREAAFRILLKASKETGTTGLEPRETECGQQPEWPSNWFSLRPSRRGHISEDPLIWGLGDSKPCHTPTSDLQN